MDLQKKINNIDYKFYTTTGFTYGCIWEYDTTSGENISDIESPSTSEVENNNSVELYPDIPEYVTNQHYFRGVYDMGYYTGEWNGKPNGSGTLNYDDGIKYTITMADGGTYCAVTYNGDWLDGKNSLNQL